MENQTPIPFETKLLELTSDRNFQRTLELYLHYYKEMSVKDISEFSGRSIPTIYRTINNWEDSGSIEEKSGRGRTPDYSAKDKEKVIEKQLADRHRTLKSIFNDVQDEGLQISYDQTKRIINETFITIEAKRKIVISTKNKEKRLLWIEKHEKWRKWKWANVIS